MDWPKIARMCTRVLIALVISAPITYVCGVGVLYCAGYLFEKWYPHDGQNSLGAFVVALLSAPIIFIVVSAVALLFLCRHLWPQEKHSLSETFLKLCRAIWVFLVVILAFVSAFTTLRACSALLDRFPLLGTGIAGIFGVNIGGPIVLFCDLAVPFIVFVLILSIGIPAVRSFLRNFVY
jgi:hypothetical protein